MSRTEGVTLPRLPPQHARATSSRAIQPHAAASTSRGGMDSHRRAASEPNYTAFVGSPRQDVPQHIYRDAAMFDDVFDKKGQLLLDRNTSKIMSPLKALGYSSLYDVHCRKLFLKNKHVKSHLVNLGLITADLKVVASTTEQRQKIRAHELLERREQLLQRLETKEQNRIDRLDKLPALPSKYLANLKKVEERQERARAIAARKMEKEVREMEKSLQEQKLKYEEDHRKLLQAMEQAALIDQARRNAAHAQQEIAETLAYSKRYGMHRYEMASWYKDSDRIHNRMISMERNGWPKKYQMETKEDNTEASVTEHHVGSLSSPVPVLPSIGDARHSISESFPSHTLEDHHEVATAHTSSPPPVASQDHTSPPPPLSQVHISTALPSCQDQAMPPEAQKSEEAERPEKSNPDLEEEKTDIKETIDTADTTSPSIADPKTQTDTESETDGGVAVESSDERRQSSDTDGFSDTYDGEVLLLDSDDAFSELVRVLVAVFVREDLTGSGFISMESFVNVLGSRRLGLQLNEEEILYLVEVCNIHRNNQIPFIQVTPELPQHLIIIYRNRAENTMETYGVYAEEEWCEIIARKRRRGVVYFNKMSGVMVIGERPAEFRPYMKDEAFEDAIVDFFEMADTDKNGIINYIDFYSLLVSPMVSTRVYKNQIEQLLGLFVQYFTQEGLMSLEMFVPLARTLLLMIYQNTYLNEEEWIELESRKMGRFYFNKVTGETFLPSSDGGLPPGVTAETKITPKKRKKKTSRTVSWSDLTAPRVSQAGPPPLIRKSKGSTSQDEEEATNTDTS